MKAILQRTQRRPLAANSFIELSPKSSDKWKCSNCGAVMKANSRSRHRNKNCRGPLLLQGLNFVHVMRWSIKLTEQSRSSKKSKLSISDNGKWASLKTLFDLSGDIIGSQNLSTPETIIPPPSVFKLVQQPLWWFASDAKRRCYTRWPFIGIWWDRKKFNRW